MAIIAAGKRYFLLLFSFLSIGQATVSLPFVRWAASWWTNKSSIVMLAMVNTTITTVNEYASRTLLSSKGNNPENRFFVQNAKGHTVVHKQSVINIIMTIIVSLLGGPVYFIRKMWPRFMFFTSFGAMNSALSQMLAHYIQDGYLGLSLGRFVFDLCYNSTLKFGMFEFARPVILKFHKNVMGIGIVRIAQDFLTTLFRVCMLNWFGF